MQAWACKTGSARLQDITFSSLSTARIVISCSVEFGMALIF